uniref:MH2 domain-containing protein n=1 Tax=Romanomermis culicivorax TaxID=13658 RepID=A0A915I612_ROMCU
MEDMDVASTSSGSTNDRGEIPRANIFSGGESDERWSNLESFYEDHIAATLSKIRCLDDEVWGKLILMNRNKCIAKMYLRNPLIVLDGTKNSFDGQRIGLDHFENADADEQTLEIRVKLGAGILLKVDQKGSIWVKKVTKCPIVIQNIDKPGIASFGAEILKTNGILETNVPTKIFDMKLFREDFERATRFNNIDDEITKRLLYKGIIRISFFRNENRSLRTPCWCALINLIAMELLTNLEHVKKGGLRVAACVI